MTAICKRFYMATVEPVLGVTGSATALPPSLVIDPAIYSFGGLDFVCTAEGLYVFWDALRGVTRRIIIHQNDPIAVLSGLSWLCVNGTVDNAKTISDLLYKSMHSKLCLLCGQTVVYSRAICASVGIDIPTRTVRFLTAEIPADYYDGHVAMETFVNGSWQVWDIVNGQVPTAEGNILSIKEMFNKPYTLEPVGDSHWATEAALGQFDVAAWQEMTMRTPAEAQSEYARVFQIPGIDVDGKTYWYMPTGTESRQSWVEGLSSNYVVIPKAQWEAIANQRP